MLRGQPGEELYDPSIGEVRPLIMPKVSSLRDRRNPVICQVALEPVDPLYLEGAVAASPQNARGHVDLWQPGGTVADQLYTGLVRTYVPVEPALQVARFHKVVHPGVDILIEEAGLVRPVI